jgi:hypothetical protein
MPKTPNGSASSSAGGCDPPKPARTYDPPSQTLRDDTVEWLQRFAKRLQKGKGK